MQTDFPPNMMMFGKEAFHPLYVTFGTLKIDPPKKEASPYIKVLVDNLEKIHETARKFTKQQKRTLKQNRNDNRICIT